jgi:hypothetical protein
MKKATPTLDSIFRGAIVRACALGLLLLPAAALRAGETTAPAKPDMGNLRAFVELARSDIRTEKALVIAENIQFTADEAAEFWPLHREYDLELNKLLDRRFALIMKFGPSAESMTAAQATELAKAAFDLEEQRTSLKRNYFDKFCKVIPPVKAARFFQIENQLNMVIDLQVAAILPLIK